MNLQPLPSPPRTFFCFWDWCRLTFSTVDELASHVRHDHIWKLEPMSKDEITFMRNEATVPLNAYPHSHSFHLSPGLSSGPLTPPATHISTSPFPTERTPSPSAVQVAGVTSPGCSSSSSQDAVERQLTQVDLMDMNVQIQSPGLVQNSVTSSTFQDPVFMIADGADADLQWPESEPQFTPATQLEQLSPPIEIEDDAASLVLQSERGRTFHSGTLHISPLPKRTTAFQPFQTNVRSSQDSQQTSSSGISRSSAHSYPLMLQTQAPYQSQSYELSLSQA